MWPKNWPAIVASYLFKFFLCRVTNNLKVDLPVDNAVIIVRPDFEAVAVPWRDVAENVYFLALELGTLQFVNKPLKLLCRIGAIEQQPPV